LNVNRKVPPGVLPQGGYGHVLGGGPGGAIALLFHTPVASLVDVWLVVPSLLQPTTAPTATLTVSGANWYSVIVTLVVGGGFPPPPVGLDPPQATATTTATHSHRIRMAPPEGFEAPWTFYG